jgi:hypothetical protein
MGRMVLLRHTLGDGSWHYDWLLDPAGPGPGRRGRAPESGADERRLITFRLSDRPDALSVAQVLHGVRLPDHRALYLDFEGPLSDGRGRVERVAVGECRRVRCEPAGGVVEFEARFLAPGEPSRPASSSSAGEAAPVSAKETPGPARAAGGEAEPRPVAPAAGGWKRWIATPIAGMTGATGWGQHALDKGGGATWEIRGTPLAEAS